MLCTPATSVPCERIFSEAGYISRAKRSRILPENLDKILFIKKNKQYLPTNITDFLIQIIQIIQLLLKVYFKGNCNEIIFKSTSDKFMFHKNIS